MLDRFIRRVYRRLGRHYKFVFPLAEDPAALAIATISVILLTSYYNPSTGELLTMLAAAWASTTAGVWFALWRGQPYLERVVAWQRTKNPSPEESIVAWDAATNFPMRSFRANAWIVGLIVTVPAITAIVLTLDLPWTAAPVLLAATIPPVAYGTVLNYFTAELLMRPVIEDIAARLPEDFPFAANGLLIRKRLKILLPVFTAFVGLLVAALMTGDGGTRTLALSVAAAVGVGLVLSFELTVLLSRSITAPIAALRVGLDRVRGGDYDARVPVVTSDELGELSHDFNLMAHGLAERERMREAFGTYLDRDIVPLILSGRFPREGVEVTVSIMFVDVRDFTPFAERSNATEVVAALNALFEVMVALVAAHGGHVDKFLGDGLLAVFGAPEGYVDHADRAVSAGLEIARAINRPEAELHVGVGINTGRVVAGSIGGAGRLNFSVIGDAVNVSARVEAATRDLDEDLLVTRATCDALTRPLPVESR
ncbi:MAG TPA: adenylate/guanylate cyclase domain-containing protein, partial [Solirubrobacteraceae bacterium]